MPKRINPDVEARLADLALDEDYHDWTAGRLTDKLNAEYPPTEADGPPAVSERWVRGRLPSLRDRSGYWTLRPGEQDASFLLKVLATMAGHPPRLTLDEAKWLRTIHDAAPWLLPAAGLKVARLYLAGDRLGMGRSHALDWALALEAVPVGSSAGSVAFYGTGRGS